ncbi:MAG: ABC transporter substrate-binding protein [Gemmatimonadaceae bacterium]
MLSRRVFLARSALAAYAFVRASPTRASVIHPALLAPRRRDGHLLRVGTLLGADDTELAKGLRFGAEEAMRSASLLGWRIEHVDLRASANQQSLDDVHAIVLGGGTRSASRRGIPIVRGTSQPVADDTLRIAPDDTTLARSLAELPTADRRSGASYQVVVWHPSLDRFGAEQLNNRYRAATATEMSPEAWIGWLAFKLLAETAMRARSVEPAALTSYLRAPTTQFDGHKGAPLRFSARGELLQPLYLVRRDAGSTTWTVEREIAPRSDPV